MSKTIQARFPGKCRDCGNPIKTGETITYHGKGAGVTCAECVDNEIDAPTHATEPEFAASDRALARRGLTVVRTSSGWSGTRNSRGRCEDAPCCGCCTF